MGGAAIKKEKGVYFPSRNETSEARRTAIREDVKNKAENAISEMRAYFYVNSNENWLRKELQESGYFLEQSELGGLNVWMEPPSSQLRGRYKAWTNEELQIGICAGVCCILLMWFFIINILD